MTDLDPAPYRRMLADQRYASRATAPNTIALVFDPRRQYEQDESAYTVPSPRLVQLDVDESGNAVWGYPEYLYPEREGR